MSDEIGGAMFELRDFMFKNLYTNEIAKSEESKARLMILQLYRYYAENIERLPEDYYRMISEDGEVPEIVVCDYIAGMTDQYSRHIFSDLYIPASWSKL